MCEDLEVELVLSKVDKVPPALHEERRAEWQELVDRLVAEVGAALRESEALQNRAGR